MDASDFSRDQTKRKFVARPRSNSHNQFDRRNDLEVEEHVLLTTESNSSSLKHNECLNKTAQSKHSARIILKSLSKKIFSSKAKSTINSHSTSHGLISKFEASTYRSFSDSFNNQASTSASNTMAAASVSVPLETSSVPPAGVENSPIEIKNESKHQTTEDVNNNTRNEGENSIVELENMLQQFPDKQERIRKALRELRKDFQSEGKSVGKSEETSPSTSSPEAEETPSSSEINTSTFSIKFKVPNNISRTESVKESRVTPHQVSNVERAGSWKLSRPKDFLSPPKHSTSFTPSSSAEDTPKHSVLNNPRRSESPQTSYHKVAAPFGKSLHRRASSPVIITSTPFHQRVNKSLSPLAQSEVSVKRSNSSKENNFSATPILVGQGNVRRSRSILGRVLGSKLQLNTPLASGISAVIPEVSQSSKPHTQPIDNSSTPSRQSTPANNSPPLRTNTSGRSPNNTSSKSDSDSSDSNSEPERNSYDVQKLKVIRQGSDSENSFSGNDIGQSTESEEEHSPKPESKEDKMDRFSMRSLQNRVSVKSQILAAEGGQEKQPAKNTHSVRRTKPHVSGDNLSSRLNKFSTNIDNAQTKPAYTRGLRSPTSPATVKINSSKFEQNNNIIGSKQTNGNVDNPPRSHTPKSKTEDKINNKNISTRSSRRLKESTTKKTAVTKLENVANITTAELKSHSKTSKSESTPKEVTPGSLNDVEDSLSSWSERRKQKRRQKDLNDNITETPPSTPTNDVIETPPTTPAEEVFKEVTPVVTPEESVKVTPAVTPEESLTKIETATKIEIVFDVEEPKDIKAAAKPYTLDLKQPTLSSKSSPSPVSPSSPASSDTGSTRSRRRRGRITSSKSTTSEQNSLPATPLADKPEVKTPSKPSTPKVEEKSIEEAANEKKSTSSSPVVEEVAAVVVTAEFEAPNEERQSPSIIEEQTSPSAEEQEEEIAMEEKENQKENLQDESTSENDVEADKSITSAADPIEVTQYDEKEVIEIVKDNEVSDTTDEKISVESVNCVAADEKVPSEIDINKEVEAAEPAKVVEEVTEVNEEPKQEEKIEEEEEEVKPKAKPRRRRIRSNAEDTTSSTTSEVKKEKKEKKVKKKLASPKEEVKSIPKVEVNPPSPTKKSPASSPVDDNEVTAEISTEIIQTESEEKSETESKQSEEKQKPMHITIDNVHECRDESVLEKLLETCTEFDDRRMVRKALRNLRKAKNEFAISDKLSMLKSSQRTEMKLNGQNGKSRGDISLTSKFTRSMKLDGDRETTVKTLMATRTTEISKTNSLTRVETKQRTSMSTRETKKIGSIFDREDDEDSKTNGGSKFDLERRKLERRHDIQRIRSLPATSSKDARKAFVAKLEAQSPKPTGNKKIGRSPTFVVPNAKNVKQMLLKWLQAKTRGYNHVDVTNFSSSWATGMAFCALVHHFFPDAFDYDSLDPKNRADNFNLAFETAEKFANADPLLETEDMLIMGNRPDSKCVFTYCQSLYNKLRKFETPLAPLKKPAPVKEDLRFHSVPESEDL